MHYCATCNCGESHKPWAAADVEHSHTGPHSCRIKQWPDERLGRTGKGRLVDRSGFLPARMLERADGLWIEGHLYDGSAEMLLVGRALQEPLVPRTQMRDLRAVEIHVEPAMQMRAPWHVRQG